MASSAIFSLLLLFFNSFITVRSDDAVLTAITLLNVSGTIQQAINLFNPITIPLPQQGDPISSSTSFSFPLYPHVALHPPYLELKDYRSLSLSRFAHDSAREKWLNTKLNFALRYFNRSVEQKPVVQTHEYMSPVTSNFPSTYNYIARIGVGTPPKTYHLNIDSGSDLTWLQCNPCTNCYEQDDTVYDPSGSSSFSSVDCNPQHCPPDPWFNTCLNDVCQYTIEYVDRSYTTGDKIMETLYFENREKVSNVVIGCGHNNQGLFARTEAGLFGLGRGQDSFPSQIKAKSFSYCLVEHDSTKTSKLEFNSPMPPTPAGSVTVSLLSNPREKTFYYLNLTGISVGGDRLSIPPSLFAIDDRGNGGVIIDSGASLTYLRPKVYYLLRDTFVEQSQILIDSYNSKRMQSLDTSMDIPPISFHSERDKTCFNLSQVTSMDVPTISFYFEGDKGLSLNPKNYLTLVDTEGKFCLAFAPARSSLSTIGNILHETMLVHHDLVKNLITFSPNYC